MRFLICLSLLVLASSAKADVPDAGGGTLNFYVDFQRGRDGVSNCDQSAPCRTLAQAARLRGNAAASIYLNGKLLLTCVEGGRCSQVSNQ